MSSTRGTGQKRSRGFAYSPSIAPLAFGALFFVGGVFALVHQTDFASHRATTTATVVGSHPRYVRNRCAGPSYDTVVGFTDQGGRPVTATVSNKLVCGKPSKGRTVRIEYDTTDPTHAKFPRTSNWAVPLLAVVLGGLFLVGGVAMAVSTARKRGAVRRGEPIPGSRNQRKKRERERECRRRRGQNGPAGRTPEREVARRQDVGGDGSVGGGPAGSGV